MVTEAMVEAATKALEGIIRPETHSWKRLALAALEAAEAARWQPIEAAPENEFVLVGRPGETIPILAKHYSGVPWMVLWPWVPENYVEKNIGLWCHLPKAPK